MAANGQQVFDPVLAAHNTMASQADRAQKEQAHQFLEQFQKSVCGRGTDTVYTRADMWL
jgi:transportin-3